MTIKTLLIANRGEIACRIARTARLMGMEPVGVHSSADAGARHVREIGRSLLIGGGPASESYLRIDAVIDAAKRVGADAIHPGYGFLSENAEFARACEAANILFVGPTPETLERFGDKASAKAAAVAAGVPVIGGAEGAFFDPDAIAAEVLRLGLPVLLKAVGGGGGRGQRLVRDAATLRADIEGALREARSTFGSEGLLIERFLTEARHVEVQIAGDGRGGVIHLFERDCTLQRRHQKVIEEAPAWGLPQELLARLRADSVRLGESLNFRGLGTVEFLVTGESYFFLEVNPRLQVEHPVTEAITGLDLVALQLGLIAGDPLPSQGAIQAHGHAFEARLYGEDPAQDFTPSTGKITVLALPGDLRIDSGVDAGDSVSPFYDPMIAKLITHADTREAALAQLAGALDHVVVEGVQTNRAFLGALARSPAFATMQVHTRWIDGAIETLTRSDEPALLWQAVATALFVLAGRETGATDLWNRRDVFTGWRLGLGDTPQRTAQAVSLSRPGGKPQEFAISPIGNDGHFALRAPDGTEIELKLEERRSGQWQLIHDGEVQMIDARTHNGLIEMGTRAGRILLCVSPPADVATDAAGADRILTSPLTGMIVRLLVAEGGAVAEGDTIAILESMKMEISIRAPLAGIVSNLTVTEGAMVDRGQAVAEILPQEGPAA